MIKSPHIAQRFEGRLIVLRSNSLFFAKIILGEAVNLTGESALSVYRGPARRRLIDAALNDHFQPYRLAFL